MSPEFFSSNPPVFARFSKNSPINYLAKWFSPVHRVWNPPDWWQFARSGNTKPLQVRSLNQGHIKDCSVWPDWAESFPLLGEFQHFWVGNICSLYIKCNEKMTQIFLQKLSKFLLGARNLDGIQNSMCGFAKNVWSHCQLSSLQGD